MELMPVNLPVQRTYQCMRMAEEHHKSIDQIDSSTYGEF